MTDSESESFGSLAEILEYRAKLEKEYRNGLERIRRAAPEVLKSFRKRYGISQEGLAGMLGLNSTYVSKIETGGKLFGMDSLVRLVEIEKEKANEGKE